MLLYRNQSICSGKQLTGFYVMGNLAFNETIFTAQKMKFSIKDFSSKCDQIRKKLQIWSHLLKKSLMENFIFSVVIWRKIWERSLSKSRVCSCSTAMFIKVYKHVKFNKTNYLKSTKSYKMSLQFKTKTKLLTFKPTLTIFHSMNAL